MINQFINAITESEYKGFLQEPNNKILTGYSGEKVIGCLQRLTSLFSQEKNICYLEVGVYQGLTLLSTALACPKVKCYGVDNFAQFDPKKENYGIVKERQNKLGINNIEIINKDYEDALEQLDKYIGERKIAVYFIDGPHDYRSQLMCLELALPYLHSNAVIIIDDCNYQHVRQANRDFLVTHPEYKLLFESYTKSHPNHMTDDENIQARKGWWNGINILVKDINNSLTPMFPPTERDRTNFENEHHIHPHFLAKLAPDTLNLVYSTYELYKQGQEDNIGCKIKNLYKKMDDLANTYSRLGYNIHKNLNTFSQYLSNNYNSKTLKQDNKNDSENYVITAKKLAKENKLIEAIASYHQAIKINHNSAWSHYNLAESLTKINAWDEAILSYRQAIQFNPNSSSFHYSLANALIKQGNIDEGVIQYKKAIVLKPQNKLIRKKLKDIYHDFYNLAEQFFKENKLEKAIAHYQKSIELNPDFVWSHFGLGQAFQQQGKLTEAIASFNRAIESNPNISDIYHWLGETFVKQGNIDRAIASYNKALELNPNTAHYHRGLGYAMFKKEEPNRAIEYLRKSLELNPKYIAAYNQLGEVLRTQNKYSEAIQCYQKSAELNPKSFVPYAQIAEILAQQQQLEEAVIYYKKAIELNSNHQAKHPNLIEALS